MEFSANCSFQDYTRWEPEDREVSLDSEPSSPTLLVSVSIIKQLTTHIAEIYSGCDPNYEYDYSKNPRRELTARTAETMNDGHDNMDNDYILNIRDTLVNPDGVTYTVLDLLGKGTFGQVVKCRRAGGDLCAAKVLKNKPAYFHQGLVEVKILKTLNEEIDTEDDKHIVRLIDYFVYHNHLVIIFELLSLNIFELIKRNNYRGLSVSLIRVFTSQILNAIEAWSDGSIIHCDLKPENILLKKDKAKVKVIDFGSAWFEHGTVFTYIQSRFYRSPEVILGNSYGPPIDMWSLGCIVAEMFIGIPLFPGTNNFDQLNHIIEMIGMPPDRMLEAAEYRAKYFNQIGENEFIIKSYPQYIDETKLEFSPSNRYLQGKKLFNLHEIYPLRKGSPEEQAAEQQKRVAMSDFLKGLLKIDPRERWTPEQAIWHPFIINDNFENIPFNPPDPKPKKPINQATIKRGSCPSVMQRYMGGSIDSQSSSSSVASSYRPVIDAIPEDTFQGFSQGKIAQLPMYPPVFLDQERNRAMIVDPINFYHPHVFPEVLVKPRFVNRRTASEEQKYEEDKQKNKNRYKKLSDDPSLLRRPESPSLDVHENIMRKRKKRRQYVLKSQSVSSTPTGYSTQMVAKMEDEQPQQPGRLSIKFNNPQLKVDIPPISSATPRTSTGRPVAGKKDDKSFLDKVELEHQNKEEEDLDS